MRRSLTEPVRVGGEDGPWAAAGPVVAMGGTARPATATTTTTSTSTGRCSRSRSSAHAQHDMLRRRHQLQHQQQQQQPQQQQHGISSLYSLFPVTNRTYAPSSSSAAAAAAVTPMQVDQEGSSGFATLQKQQHKEDDDASRFPLGTPWKTQKYHTPYHHHTPQRPQQQGQGSTAWFRLFSKSPAITLQTIQTFGASHNVEEELDEQAMRGRTAEATPRRQQSRRRQAAVADGFIAAHDIIARSGADRWTARGSAHTEDDHDGGDGDWVELTSARIRNALTRRRTIPTTQQLHGDHTHRRGLSLMSASPMLPRSSHAAATLFSSTTQKKGPQHFLDTTSALKITPAPPSGLFSTSRQHGGGFRMGGTAEATRKHGGVPASVFPAAAAADGDDYAPSPAYQPLRKEILEGHQKTPSRRVLDAAADQLHLTQWIERESKRRALHAVTQLETGNSHRSVRVSSLSAMIQRRSDSSGSSGLVVAAGATVPVAAQGMSAENEGRGAGVADSEDKVFMSLQSRMHALHVDLDSRIERQRKIDQLRADPRAIDCIVDEWIQDYVAERVCDAKKRAPLTGAEQMLYESVANGTCRRRVLADKFNIEIRLHDAQTLTGLNWLNDEIVNFYMSMLYERSKRNIDPRNSAIVPRSARLRCYFFSTFFYAKLYGTNGPSRRKEYKYENVRRWSLRAKVRISQLDRLFVPVHVGSGTHWCLAVVNFEHRRLEYYDSLSGDGGMVLRHLKRYVQDESEFYDKGPFSFAGWSSVNARCPKQHNGSDCGMFVCKHADYLSEARPLSFSQEDMPYFRARMLSEICNGRVL